MKLVRNLRHIWFVALLILAATGVRPVAGQNSGTSTPASEPAWSVAAVGDAIMTRQVKCFENGRLCAPMVSKPVIFQSVASHKLAWTVAVSSFMFIGGHAFLWSRAHNRWPRTRYWLGPEAGRAARRAECDPTG